MPGTNRLRLEALLDTSLAAEPFDGGDRLADLLCSESRLLREFQSTLRMQRLGVAADDVEAVDRSVHAAHRLLITLGEARERRHLLLRELGVSSDVPVGALEAELGARLTGQAREALHQLQMVAQELAREIRGNRQLLMIALEENNAYAQALYGQPEHGPVYDAEARKVSGPSNGGTLLNRQV